MRLTDALEGGLAWTEKRPPDWQPLREKDWPDFL
jgi:hypothetical protein